MKIMANAVAVDAKSVLSTGYSWIMEFISNRILKIKVTLFSEWYFILKKYESYMNTCTLCAERRCS
jgi:hypothetical protein